MNSQTPETDLRVLWQSLETEVTMVSAQQLQARSLEFLRKNRRDAIARFVFVLIASVFCGLVGLTARLSTVRVVALVVMAMLFASAVRRLHRSMKMRGASTADSAGMPWKSCVEFYRRELEKQQAFAAQPLWQMAAALLVIAWLAPGALGRTSSDPLRIVLLAVLFAAAGLIVWMAVRKLQVRRVEESIDALNAFEKEDRSHAAE